MTFPPEILIKLQCFRIIHNKPEEAEIGNSYVGFSRKFGCQCIHKCHSLPIALGENECLVGWLAGCMYFHYKSRNISGMPLAGESYGILSLVTVFCRTEFHSRLGNVPGRIFQRLNITGFSVLRKTTAND